MTDKNDGLPLALTRSQVAVFLSTSATSGKFLFPLGQFDSCLSREGDFFVHVYPQYIRLFGPAGSNKILLSVGRGMKYRKLTT